MSNLIFAVDFTSTSSSSYVVYAQAADGVVQDEEPQFINHSSDTVQALTNLFARKRTGCAVRGVIFALFAGSAVGAGISSGLPINFVFAGVYIYIVVRANMQVKRYSQEQLEIVLHDYQNGKGIPPDILKKLKAKDFRPVTQLTN